MNNLILLVEDNNDDIMLVRRSVGKHRLKPRLKVFNTGIEALDYLFSRDKFVFRDRREDPEIILLDLMLPHMSGFKVLEEIRSSMDFKKIPVIIFTSSNVEKDVRVCYELGANSFIQKPIDYKAYNYTIESMMDYWLGINLTPVS